MYGTKWEKLYIINCFLVSEFFYLTALEIILLTKRYWI